jgi:hypothetical protein
MSFSLATPARQFLMPNTDLGQSHLGVLQQPLARLVQPRPHARALVQGHLRCMFEPDQCLVQRRLRQAQRRGGLGLRRVRGARHQRVQHRIADESGQRCDRGGSAARSQSLCCAVQGVQRARDAQGQRLACVRHRHAASTALEQRHAEPLLGALHGPGYRSRGQVQRLGGTRHASHAGDGGHSTQCTQRYEGVGHGAMLAGWQGASCCDSCRLRNTRDATAVAARPALAARFSPAAEVRKAVCADPLPWHGSCGALRGDRGSRDP